MIDEIHVTILGPIHLASQNINQKGFFSVDLWALGDHQGRFIEINVGWSRRVIMPEYL